MSLLSLNFLKLSLVVRHRSVEPLSEMILPASMLLLAIGSLHTVFALPKEDSPETCDVAIIENVRACLWNP